MYRVVERTPTIGPVKPLEEYDFPLKLRASGSKRRRNVDEALNVHSPSNMSWNEVFAQSKNFCRRTANSSW